MQPIIVAIVALVVAIIIAIVVWSIVIIEYRKMAADLQTWRRRYEGQLEK